MKKDLDNILNEIFCDDKSINIQFLNTIMNKDFALGIESKVKEIESLVKEIKTKQVTDKQDSQQTLFKKLQSYIKLNINDKNRKDFIIELDKYLLNHKILLLKKFKDLIILDEFAEVAFSELNDFLVHTIAKFKNLETITKNPDSLQQQSNKELDFIEEIRQTSDGSLDTLSQINIKDFLKYLVSTTLLHFITKESLEVEEGSVEQQTTEVIDILDSLQKSVVSNHKKVKLFYGLRETIKKLLSKKIDSDKISFSEFYKKANKVNTLLKQLTNVINDSNQEASTTTTTSATSNFPELIQTKEEIDSFEREYNIEKALFIHILSKAINSENIDYLTFKIFKLLEIKISSINKLYQNLILHNTSIDFNSKELLFSIKLITDFIKSIQEINEENISELLPNRLSSLNNSISGIKTLIDNLKKIVDPSAEGMAKSTIKLSATTLQSHKEILIIFTMLHTRLEYSNKSNDKKILLEALKITKTFATEGNKTLKKISNLVEEAQLKKKKEDLTVLENQEIETSIINSFQRFYIDKDSITLLKALNFYRDKKALIYSIKCLEENPVETIKFLTKKQDADTPVDKSFIEASIDTIRKKGFQLDSLRVEEFQFQKKFQTDLHKKTSDLTEQLLIKALKELYEKNHSDNKSVFFLFIKSLNKIFTANLVSENENTLLFFTNIFTNKIENLYSCLPIAYQSEEMSILKELLIDFLIFKAQQNNLPDFQKAKQSILSYFESIINQDIRKSLVEAYFGEFANKFILALENYVKSTDTNQSVIDLNDYSDLVDHLNKLVNPENSLSTINEFIKKKPNLNIEKIYNYTEILEKHRLNPIFKNEHKYQEFLKEYKFNPILQDKVYDSINYVLLEILTRLVDIAKEDILNSKDITNYLGVFSIFKHFSSNISNDLEISTYDYFYVKKLKTLLDSINKLHDCCDNNHEIPSLILKTLNSLVTNCFQEVESLTVSFYESFSQSYKQILLSDYNSILEKETIIKKLTETHEYIEKNLRETHEYIEEFLEEIHEYIEEILGKNHKDISDEESVYKKTMSSLLKKNLSGDHEYIEKILEENHKDISDKKTVLIFTSLSKETIILRLNKNLESLQKLVTTFSSFLLFIQDNSMEETTSEKLNPSNSNQFTEADIDKESNSKDVVTNTDEESSSKDVLKTMQEGHKNESLLEEPQRVCGKSVKALAQLFETKQDQELGKTIFKNKKVEPKGMLHPGSLIRN